MSRLDVVVPAGLDDPARPSGGNIYDRRLINGLTGAGWGVRVHEALGSWPSPDVDALSGLDAIIAAIPDGCVVLLDGLIASAAPSALLPHAQRVRMVVLVHMPLGVPMPPGPAIPQARPAEGAVLSAASAVVTTSQWTRDRLLEIYALNPTRVIVARPGVDPAGLASGSIEGSALLCVAALGPHKGQDVLIQALGELAHRAWTCTFVGALDRDPDYVQRLIRRAGPLGILDRVAFVGPRMGDDLDRSYAGADLLVVPSRFESYGMVITEALARGIPVIASAVGGTSEAMGGTGPALGQSNQTAHAARPGLLIPPGDPFALREALRQWLDGPALRASLRLAAQEARSTLSDWTKTTQIVTSVLAQEALTPPS
jgi:glycosyltransferase involved in cell wall biosynthesis